MMAFFWGEHRIDYHLERASRKTLAITVKPDASVIVRAPENADAEAIGRVLRKRASWILRQQRYFDQFTPRTTPREYIGGETHLYLGRRYRLRLRTCDTPSVGFVGGYLCVHTPDPADAGQVKATLDAWYAQRATEVFAERLTYCRRIAAFRDLPAAETSIRFMSKRWGSCSSAKLLTINTDLVRAPRLCIDYVLVHELCHLIHQNHSQEFYQLLSVVMPDWEARKLRLERLLS
ncbi:MAG: M48 family metallopeptidase [Fibrella sp.]|nr:M48 family metallopeptidase [Armatimonadota bacterium]